MTPVTGGSLRQIAYDVKTVLESIAFNKLEYADVTYEQIRKILEAQLESATPETFNIRHTRVRDFYDYLLRVGVKTNAYFPAQTVQTRYMNQDDNFLSHTSFKDGKTYVHDDGHKRTNTKEDYRNEIISMATYGKLYRALAEIDPVYAVVAQVMMQTYLRIADVCEMPLHKNCYNTYLPAWPEFERSGKETLKYSCVTKRSKHITIDIYPDTVKAIYTDYIQPYYRERKELFESKYMKRKNASLEFGNIRDRGRRSCSEDILWLTSTGVPLKPYMIEEAFRETGLGVNPHMLRHSGPTHTLYYYCKLHGIEPDVRMAAVFHEVLKDQLGHADIETTRMYIRTLIRLRARKTMPFVLPGNKGEIDKRLPKVVKEAIDRHMVEFFEYRAQSADAITNQAEQCPITR